MHFNLDQILWGLVLAGHLIVLIVLLGRERARRFPLFTIAIALSALRLLTDHLLHGRLTMVAFYWQQYGLLLISALLSGAVLAELARAGFGGRQAVASPAFSPAVSPADSRQRMLWSLLSMLAAGGIVGALGPWPTWASLVGDQRLLPLRLVWVGAVKLDLFMGMLSVLLFIALLVAGRRFGTRFRSHTTQIALGLSTIAISQAVVQRIIEGIADHAHPTSREQYDRILHLVTNLDHGRVAVWALTLAWWTVWLWRDEPAMTTAAVTFATSSAAEPAPQP